MMVVRLVCIKTLHKEKNQGEGWALCPQEGRGSRHQALAAAAAGGAEAAEAGAQRAERAQVPRWKSGSPESGSPVGGGSGWQLVSGRFGFAFAFGFCACCNVSDVEH